MSPFIRDVGQILLDDGSTLRELWASMNPPKDENGGGGSGTMSRRHSVSVVQPDGPPPLASMPQATTPRTSRLQRRIHAYSALPRSVVMASCSPTMISPQIWGHSASPKTGLGQRRQLTPRASHPHFPFTPPYREVHCCQTGYPPINASISTSQPVPLLHPASASDVRVIVVCLLVAALPAASWNNSQ
ncbi:hypothetical protein BKA83DRAFT_2533065 [Pisolithus microcarpus]|nr:hypothetical protein BKA83DRAFT_2533065 [Pisolithus microcarpus]